MRILVVPKWYPWPELPVFGVFCREHAAALATRHDVVVLATLFTPDPPDFRVFKLTDQVEDGLRVLRVRYRRPRLRPLALVCQLAGMAAAVRLLRREGWRPGVVHAHVYSAALPALAVGRLSRALVAVTEHYTGFGRGLITGNERRLARFAFERADVVAPVSRELEGTLRELAPKANYVVVPNTVDTDAFEPPAERPPGLRLLNVAALAEKKGHRFLLEAMTELPEATLVIAGDGELRGELEERVRELALEDRVTFSGEQPKHEVARLMREAGLFVLPSLAENLPVVLIEAMASGLPAVATRVGGVPEMLGDEDGVLVEPEDPPALAAAIREAAGRAFDPQAMAARARDRYSYAAVCERWTEVYAGLASSRGSSSEATRRATASSE
ncbi:MAG TPA: glycosyltransferase [Thermoleophilaceae bacterium]|nr:glycosyltransferase [Thermoleophilaceae bacterium]